MPMMTKDQKQQKMTKQQQAISRFQKDMLKMLRALGWTCFFFSFWAIRASRP